ncbi:CRISPR-associated protein, Crm2 family [Thermobaculum terrenum ATCC BAA-798]|uniref:CRISPR-associated protein, Crm2 family n=1 Tax=Thermobaculum terrenum (strain ATCC BAA-798 / CCMEE 7001 / YNP1) TaxID=525904 RepID=D1CGI6_THET1|nr:type III-B CRISPR-associated protein Cas10/Cmr2 [Thermobaculum terrenum]ACZ42857.1 CRISPR-associated protein, Crm2 family [Thermobaculum terrenum ATCC BAA-798]
MNYVLQFSFSPVQEFVAEARKTADLRTGSFLISYLSVRAAHAAIEQAREDGDPDAEGRLFPDITNDPIYRRLSGQSQDQPDTGSFPNQFSLSVPDEQTARRWAEAAQGELQKAWEEIASRAWQQLESWYHQQMDDEVKKLWDQQIKNTWAIFWVVSEGGISGQLNSRKLLRNFRSVLESGENCTVCGHRSHLGMPPSSQKQRVNRQQFWEELRSGPLGIRGLLGPKERLCAVCMTKRLLPERGIAKDCIGWNLEGQFPSTPAIAAHPWGERVIADSSALRAADEFVGSLADVLGRNSFRAMDYASHMDFFYESYYDELITDRKRRDNALRELHAFFSRTQDKVGLPGNTVAVLAMDGDRLGQRLAKISEHPEREAKLRELSGAILRFSQEVRAIFDDYRQRPSPAALVYAGGEDVLALLPINLALEIVQKIRQAYVEATAQISRDIGEDFTISGGLLFAPMNLPLRTMIRTTHMLEDVAKEEAGRNALAISVWRGSGEILRLARKWSDGGTSAIVDKLTGLTGMVDDYPSRFLYQAIDLLNTMQSEHSPLDQEAISKLLAVELWGSREKKYQIDTIEQAEQRLAPLLEAATHNGKLDPAVFRLLRFFQEEQLGAESREGVLTHE